MIEKDSDSELSNKEWDWLNRAMTLAALSDQRHKHGAIAIKGNRVIGFGVNTYRNSPRTVGDAFDSCSVHAEVNAIRHNPTAGRGATMVIARVNKSGEPRLSRPCLRCYTYLKELGFRKIIFTA